MWGKRLCGSLSMREEAEKDRARLGLGHEVDKSRIFSYTKLLVANSCKGNYGWR